MKSPKAMNVEGQEVVLDEAPIFSLILGHDTEIRVMKPSSQLTRFASPLVSGTFRPDDIHGDLQYLHAPLMQRRPRWSCFSSASRVTIWSPRNRAASVPQWVINVFSWESSSLSKSPQESLQLKLDLFGLLPWPTEAEQEVIRIPDIPQAPEVGIVRIARRHLLGLSA